MVSLNVTVNIWFVGIFVLLVGLIVVMVGDMVSMVYVVFDAVFRVLPARSAMAFIGMYMAYVPSA